MEWYSSEYDKWNLLSTMNCSHNMSLRLLMCLIILICYDYAIISQYPKEQSVYLVFTKTLQKVEITPNPNQNGMLGKERESGSERERMNENMNLWSWGAVSQTTEKRNNSNELYFNFTEIY